MLKQACPCCKVAGIFAIVGALNSGMTGLLRVNYIDKIFSYVHLARVVDGLTALAALVLIAGYFMADCPICKKQK
ncbi:MAG: DUF378 domain-containing protein [Candidatus Omnitrophica bacterium]|nr:DUF378 domain-containing protein [Candidatus Omnitrophota bacterium]